MADLDESSKRKRGLQCYCLDTSNLPLACSFLHLGVYGKIPSSAFTNFGLVRCSSKSAKEEKNKGRDVDALG